MVFFPMIVLQPENSEGLNDKYVIMQLIQTGVY